MVNSWLLFLNKQAVFSIVCTNGKCLLYLTQQNQDKTPNALTKQFFLDDYHRMHNKKNLKRPWCKTSEIF